MITTLTANPCIDRTLATEQFDLYKMNRVRVLRSDFGGKGINVSAAVHTLGGETLCTGLCFQENEKAFLQKMEHLSIPCDMVTLPGGMRSCYKLFDETLRHTIEINEYGEEVPASTQDLLLQKVAELSPASTVFTLSGSLPKGFTTDFYAKCASVIRQKNPRCKILADAEQTLLLETLKTGFVSFLKPNIHEFESTFSCKIHSEKELHQAAQEVLREYALEMICVSMGAEGAYITDGKEAFFCESPRVTVRSIQGAGDSLIAGMCLALEQNKSLPEILLYGVCAAGDSIAKEGTLLCTKEGVELLLRNDPPFCRKIA